MVEAVQYIGVTRSGKAIQAPIFGDDREINLPAVCASYTPADYFDAHAVFEYLISRELSLRSGDIRALSTYERMSDEHKSKLDINALDAQRLSLGLPTVFDVLEHGKGLADRIFKD
jgi:hypothetical protein